MYQKIKAYVKKHHMLEKEDKVIVGVSGGADSVCLLFMLLKLREEWGIEVTAVHVHHGLRGQVQMRMKHMSGNCARNREFLLWCSMKM